MRIRQLLLGSLLVPAFALAGATLSGHDVKFKASGTGGLKIEGRVKRMAVTESGGTVVFTVAAEDVDTGIGLRNKHMRGYLESDKFPQITLAVPRAELILPEGGKESTGTVRGWFTAHGVTRPAVIGYSIKQRKKVYKVDARFEFDIREHGIQTPSYLGVTVDPVMPVNASVEVAAE